MSTLQTLNNSETGLIARGKINDNFTELNTDKAEKSGGTFTGDISVPDEAYGAGWNGSLEVPTKNSVYDKIETISGGGSTTLAGLTDVDIVTPANGEIIAYNSTSTKWENVTLSGGGDMLASTYDPAGGARQVSFACTTQTAITDYTFTGTEARDSGYLVTTASNRTVNISPDLFTTGFEVTICKGTNNANTVTLDAQTGNNINGTQTFVITQYNEAVTLLKDGVDTWKIKSHYYPISGTNTGDNATNTQYSGLATSKANLSGGNTFSGTQILSGTGRLLDIGDDAAFYDVNIANAIALKGQGDATIGRLQLGTSAYIQGNGDGTVTINGAISGVGTSLTGTASGLTSGITNGLKSATTTVSVSSATAPSTGQVLTATNSTTATWQTPASGGTIRRVFSIAGKIGATGTNVANTFVADGTFTISKVSLWYGTAGSGTLTVDVNKNGTTLFATTKPSITTTNQSSINSGTLTTTTLASGDVLTIDIDAVPGTPGTDLYVEIVYS